MIESGIINCTSTRPHAAGDFLSVREKQETKQPVGRKGEKKDRGEKRAETWRGQTALFSVSEDHACERNITH